MKRSVRPILPLISLWLAVVTLFLTSCTVPTGAHITKVNPYHLRPGVQPTTEEDMIDFEYRRKVRGAVTAEDYYDRYGNYFTVFWRTDRRDLPVTIRLEYRQASTGPRIFALEHLCEAPTRSNTTEFRIVGDEYAQGGAVTQWKASIMQDDVVVDEFKSFLWQ